MYENEPALQAMATEFIWTQNVVIMEEDLTMVEWERYLKAACRFDWSNAELITYIADNAHENIILAIAEDACYIVEQEEKQTKYKLNVVSNITSTICKTGWRTIRER